MSRIFALPILFTVAVAFTLKQEDQKEKETFSNQQKFHSTAGAAQQPNDVIVEEIPKKQAPQNEKVIVSEIEKPRLEINKNNDDAIEKKKEIMKKNRDTVPTKGTPVFTKVEVQPKFAGDWGRFLQEHLNPVVPVNNGAPSGQYTVIAQFIVDKQGNISDLKTITEHGYGMEEEVLRVLKLMPKWEPALQNGKKVTAYRKQPVTFVISEE